MTRPFLIAIFLCTCLAASAVGALGISHIAYADGQSAAPALVDGGAAIAAEQPAAAAPSSAPNVDTPDPIANPTGALSATRAVYERVGLFASILFALIAFAKAFAARGWFGLDRGKRAVLAAGAIGTASAVFDAWANGGVWLAAMSTGLLALAAIVDAYTAKKPTPAGAG